MKNTLKQEIEVLHKILIDHAFEIKNLQKKLAQTETDLDDLRQEVAELR